MQELPVHCLLIGILILYLTQVAWKLVDKVDDDGDGEMRNRRHEDDELSMFNHVEITSQYPRYVDQPAVSTSTMIDEMRPLEASELLKAMNNQPPREYPPMFHSVEFLSYNPIPERLESVLFPTRRGHWHYTMIPIGRASESVWHY